jgi:hypothetical protein
VSSGWTVPQAAGQRPRRYYRLTGEGAVVARVELARLSAAGPAPARPGRPAPGSPGMRGERGLLRTGEFLVAVAARRLPAGVRDERYQEWAAELLAILQDPSAGPAWRRAAGMLGYCPGHHPRHRPEAGPGPLPQGPPRKRPAG